MIPKEIIIHHTASNRDNTTLKDIENWHKARWFGFVSSLGYHIGYHFVIFSNGEIVQTRRENEVGAHAVPNEGRIGIALTGNFEEEKPTDEQLKSLNGLIERLKKDYKIEVKGHREVSKTLCPGKELHRWLLLNRKISLLKKIVQLLMAKLSGKTI